MIARSVRVVFTFFIVNKVFVSVLCSGSRCDKYAEYGDFTHQVSLRDEMLYHQCGGALISDRWALSSASCRSAPIQFMAVGVFTLDEADIYVVDNIIIHEHFDQSTGINNIALVRTNREIQLSQYAQPIPYSKVHLAACDANLIAVGWTDTGGPGDGSGKLRYVNLTAIKNDECESLVQGQGYDGFTVNPTSFCTIAENMNTGDCLSYFFLSSLPLTFSEHRILHGIAPAQPNSASMPLIVTEVSNYADWISINTNVVGVNTVMSA